MKQFLYLIAVIYKDEEKIKSGHDWSWHVEVVLKQQQKKTSNYTISLPEVTELFSQTKMPVKMVV